MQQEMNQLSYKELQSPMTFMFNNPAIELSCDDQKCWKLIIGDQYNYKVHHACTTCKINLCFNIFFAINFR